MEQIYSPKNFSPLENSIFKKPEKSNKKKNWLQILLELDLFTHFILLISIIILFFQYVKIKQSNETIERAALKNQAATSSAQTVVAAPIVSSSSLFIHQQVVSIDKKYYNLPEKFVLTLRGPIKKEVFGYFPYWLVEHVDDIDIQIITTLSYFGLEIDADGNIVGGIQKDSFNPYDIWQNDSKLKDFLARAKKNKTKIYLTFKSFDNDVIKKLVASSESSQRFLETVLYQVSSHNLAGVNIDFEYTGIPDVEIRNKFSVLMSSLNDTLKRHNPNTALTIAVYVTAATISQLWDIPYLTNHSDNIIVMGYDFFTPKSVSAGPVAPLAGYTNSLSGMINNFLEQAPPDKITLAIPYYAYDWTTENQGKNAKAILGVDAKALSYAEANDMAKGKSIIWDSDSQTPWYSYVDQVGQIHVVHFENVQSLGVKYDLVNKKNLHGVGIWALGLEGKDSQPMQLLIDKFSY